MPIFSVQTIAAPAAIVDSSHWATLPPACEWWTVESAMQRRIKTHMSSIDLTNTGDLGRGYLYDGPASYDDDIFNYDELNRGTITLGEALTANAGTAVAPAFKGQVHLVRNF